MHKLSRKKQDGFLINPFRMQIPPQTDPSFSSVSLLINEGEASGTTVIPDRSSHNRTLTSEGGVVYSNAITKFGVSSIKFPNDASVLVNTLLTSLNLGTADFTIEWWWNAITTNAFNDTMFTSGINGAATGMIAYLDSSAYGFRNGNGSVIILANTANQVPLGAWKYYTITRAAGVFRKFVDGTLIETVTLDRAIDCNAGLRIGCGDNGSGARTAFMDGYCGGLRVTSGVARYTANFTPPTAVFPTA